MMLQELICLVLKGHTLNQIKLQRQMIKQNIIYGRHAKGSFWL